MFNNYAYKEYNTNNLNSRINSANKVELVQLIYENIAQRLMRLSVIAESLVKENNYKLIKEKTELVQKVLTIIELGLLAHLDKENGKDVAKNLETFYIASISAITQANLKNNPQEFKKLSNTYNAMGEAWKTIKI